MSDGPAGMLDRLLGERRPLKRKATKTKPAAAPARDTAGPAPTRRNKLRLVVNVDGDLLERLRRAAYWLPGTTIAGVAEAGILRELERLERHHGEALKPIPAGQAVKRGRPVRGQ